MINIMQLPKAELMTFSGDPWASGCFCEVLTTASIVLL